MGCHLADYQNTTAPNHVAASFPTTCETCHTTGGWTGATFNHSWWPLTGQHAVPPAQCTQCHIGGIYTTNPPTACVGCHLADYTATTSPPHAANNFPQTCQTCHTTTGWQPATFNHTAYYPLSGAHTSPPLACTACHLGGIYTVTLPTTCVGCHGPSATVDPDYSATSNATHQQLGGSPTPCSDCHNNSAWLPSTFNHSSFALTGLHLSTACTQCHTGSGYGGAPTTCVGCHLADYQSPNTVPNHVTANFPQTCETCHTTSGWTGATFNHSWWPLTGLHTVPPRQCTQCHIGGVYTTNPPTACVGCHLADYQNPANVPNHVSAGFPQTCQTCHTTSGWTGATFDHSVWPLSGAHTVPPRACTDCHINNDYGPNQPTTCVGCHLANYTATTSPPHVSNNFPQTCQTCHTTTAWQPATFNHSTYYALSGAHVSPPLACSACHVGGNYTTTLPTTCVGCHGSGATIDAQYNASSNLTHQQLGINPPACTMCHGNTTWLPSSFTHSTWPLTGLHLPPHTTSCSQCHTGRNYTNAPTACVGLPPGRLPETTNVPNHVTAGFPQTCQTCHTTSGWTGATLQPQLVAARRRAPVPPRVCADCHPNGNYSTMPNTCVGCHLASYTGTTNPPHVTNNFPQTCATCHNTVAWQPATFTHTDVGFDLTGAHVSPPLACGNCHVNGNYSVTLPTTCVGCHQSDYNSTTNPNHSQLGLPTTCTNCHIDRPGLDAGDHEPHRHHRRVLVVPHAGLQLDHHPRPRGPGLPADLHRRGRVLLPHQHDELDAERIHAEHDPRQHVPAPAPQLALQPVPHDGAGVHGLQLHQRRLPRPDHHEQPPQRRQRIPVQQRRLLQLPPGWTGPDGRDGRRRDGQQPAARAPRATQPPHAAEEVPGQGRGGARARADPAPAPALSRTPFSRAPRG